MIGLVVYAGGTLSLIALVLPAARNAPTPQLQRSFLASALRIYDPLMIAALGVVVISGATNLTTYKDALRGEFFARMGWLLVWKLGLAFFVIMVGTYITFGLGHRIVRDEQLEEHANPAWLASMSRRLTWASIFNLILMAATVWLGLAMGHPAVVGKTS
ncbi:MAG TPA: hypothetical protein VEB21_00210 [Terriglobales bacterium]|nr:hypothetical protein [Terriglobales bacterium]